MFAHPRRASVSGVPGAQSSVRGFDGAGLPGPVSRSRDRDQALAPIRHHRLRRYREPYRPPECGGRASALFGFPALQQVMDLLGGGLA